jgi:hypothetical protein
VTDHDSPTDRERHSPEITIDLDAAHPARIYNYLAGGRANFAVDRDAVDQAATILPGGLDTVRRAIASMAGFQARVVRYLLDEAGIRQFLKMGTVVPTGQDVHEIAQSVAHDTRVLYVGDDATVLAHAHSMRQSSPNGVTGYIHGSLLDLEEILREAPATLDLDRPLAILLPGALSFIPDEQDPHGLVARLIDAVAPGSYLALTHTSQDLRSERMQEAADEFTKLLSEAYVVRSRDDIASFLDGLDLVDPGLVPIVDWRPSQENQAPDTDADLPLVPIYGALARKP